LKVVSLAVEESNSAFSTQRGLMKKESTVPAKEFFWFVTRYVILKRTARFCRQLSKTLESKAALLQKSLVLPGGHNDLYGSQRPFLSH
jgi:hypothetical protein